MMLLRLLSVAQREYLNSHGLHLEPTQRHPNRSFLFFLAYFRPSCFAYPLSHDTLNSLPRPTLQTDTLPTSQHRTDAEKAHAGSRGARGSPYARPNQVSPCKGSPPCAIWTSRDLHVKTVHGEHGGHQKLNTELDRVVSDSHPSTPRVVSATRTPTRGHPSGSNPGTPRLPTDMRLRRRSSSLTRVPMFPPSQGSTTHR
jgi:hypothetical protein